MTSIDSVQHRFEAQALTVCHVGPVTSLRLQLRGESASIVVLLPTPTFIEKKDAKRDDNGVAWPILSKELPPEAAPEIKIRAIPFGSYDDRRRASMERGWLIFKNQPERSAASIAREIGEQDSEMTRYFKAHHSDEFAAVHKLRAELFPRTRKSRISAKVLEKAYDEFMSGRVKQTALAAEVGVSPSHLSQEFSRIRAERINASRNSIPA